MSNEAARGATVLPESIKDYLDIWSDPAMEMLAGIYRIPEQLCAVTFTQTQNTHYARRLVLKEA